MVEKGILFPKRIAETRQEANPQAPPTHTTVESKGWLFVKRLFRTDTKK
jgi:hypothetical protein